MMNGIRPCVAIIDRIKKFSPFREPVCTEKHHKRKKEIVSEAFDADELIKILNDTEINLNDRERELFVLNVFYHRRAIVRLLNSRYFDDINQDIPRYGRISELRREVETLKSEIEKLKAK